MVVKANAFTLNEIGIGYAKQLYGVHAVFINLTAKLEGATFVPRCWCSPHSIASHQLMDSISENLSKSCAIGIYWNRSLLAGGICAVVFEMAFVNQSR